MKTTAPCPFCDGTLTRSESYGGLILVPGQAPSVDFKWSVKHSEPLCYEWQSHQVKAEDILAAFSSNFEE